MINLRFYYSKIQIKSVLSQMEMCHFRNKGSLRGTSDMKSLGSNVIFFMIVFLESKVCTFISTKVHYKPRYFHRFNLCTIVVHNPSSKE